MIRFILGLLTLSTVCATAQDYTLSTEEDQTGPVDQALDAEMAGLLVLPYHSHYHISEVDRMMCPPTMDVPTMRDRLRGAINRAITQAFSDSLDATDLSINTGEDIDVEEYIQNALDYSYVKWEKEPEKKKGKLGLRMPKLKKKEEKVYGAKVERQDGQLKRKEINYDRYMSAAMANEGAIAYLNDLYSFDYLLVLTQLEIRRDLERQGEGLYVCALHYEMLDDQGKAIKGAKQELRVSSKQLEYQAFKSDIVPRLAKIVLMNVWTDMQTSAPPLNENSDY